MVSKSLGHRKGKLGRYVIGVTRRGSMDIIADYSVRARTKSVAKRKANVLVRKKYGTGYVGRVGFKGKWED